MARRCATHLWPPAYGARPPKEDALPRNASHPRRRSRRNHPLPRDDLPQVASGFLGRRFGSPGWQNPPMAAKGCGSAWCSQLRQARCRLPKNPIPTASLMGQCSRYHHVILHAHLEAQFAERLHTDRPATAHHSVVLRVTPWSGMASEVELAGHLLLIACPHHCVCLQRSSVVPKHGSWIPVRHNFPAEWWFQVACIGPQLLAICCKSPPGAAHISLWSALREFLGRCL